MTKIKIFDKYYDVLETLFFYNKNEPHYIIKYNGFKFLVSPVISKIIKDEIYYIPNKNKHLKVTGITYKESMVSFYDGDVLLLEFEDGSYTSPLNICKQDIRRKLIKEILK